MHLNIGMFQDSALILYSIWTHSLSELIHFHGLNAIYILTTPKFLSPLALELQIAIQLCPQHLH